MVQASSPNYYVNPDLILRVRDNTWIASNPRLRTHVELNESAVGAFVAGGSKRDFSQDQWRILLKGCEGRDRTRRGIGADGLVADHSGFLENGEGGWLSGDELLNLLVKTRLLVPDPGFALAPIKPLSGLLDRESLGTFHQRVGQHLLLERRAKEPWREWQNQKFSMDGLSLLDTPYRQLQEPFFDRYFSADRIKDFRILDFGCGNGYYTAKLVERGAHVVGLDNSSDLLEIARKNHSEKQNLQLFLTRSFEEVIDLMSRWEEGSFDLIYLQDTLLLLLQPEVGQASSFLPDLFAGFRRLIRSRGTLCAMEPNPVFWLANRYGDPSHPYAIVTEYRHPVFNVVPTLNRLLPEMSAANFALKDIQHPAPAATGGGGYQAEFPIWDFFVFVPI